MQHPTTADRAGGGFAHPTLEDARRLCSWGPPLGVVTVYLRFDPADRGSGWRTELRNGVAGVVEASAALDHDGRSAVRATADRIVARFDDRDRRGLPRGEVGFVEVSRGRGEERWWATRVPPPASGAALGERPMIAPLFSLIESGEARGVALVSAERVRLLEWALEGTEELESWELAIFSRDWRERKARATADPARTQGVSASGHDQFSDRLNDNRHRFLGECRGLASQAGTVRGWPEILAFGPAPHLTSFCEGTGHAGPPIVRAGEGDLVSIPLGQVERQIADAVERIARDRSRVLAERVVEEAGAHARGALGVRETLTALGEGRVDHLVLDVRHLAFEPVRGGPIASDSGGPGKNGAPREGAEPELDPELLIQRALQSGAAVSTVSGEPAALLANGHGVAALLRY